MGRKIPARKHRGIRDPIKQNELKFAKIKDVINNPPPKKDHQEVSYKLSQFIKLKEASKNKEFVKLKRHIDNEDRPGQSIKNKVTRREKKYKPIIQLPNESDRDYLRRVNFVTHEAIKEAEYEAKYNVDVIRNKKTGEITIKKRPDNEIDQIIKAKKLKRPLPVKTKVPKELVKEVVKEVLSEETHKKTHNKEEFKRDKIAFGEVVHCPPSLVLPRKATQHDTVPRPGKKNLLLKEMLPQKAEVKTDTVVAKPKKQKVTINKKVNLQGKRKELPMKTRKMLEDEQSRAVELYRQLKKRN